MARVDYCEGCNDPMPAGNLHCFGCGLDVAPPALDRGSILIQIYPAATQASGFEFYRVEAARLAAAGLYPIAHSWGDERVTVGMAALFGDIAASGLSGSLMVTYRQGGDS